MEKKGKGGRTPSIVADLIQVLHKPNESTGRSIASGVGEETPPQKEQKKALRCSPSPNRAEICLGLLKQTSDCLSCSFSAKYQIDMRNSLDNQNREQSSYQTFQYSLVTGKTSQGIPTLFRRAYPSTGTSRHSYPAAKEKECKKQG